MSGVPIRIRWEIDYTQINLNSFESTDLERTGYFLTECVEECTRLGLSRTHFLISAETNCLIGFITLSLRHYILPKTSLRQATDEGRDYWPAVKIDQIAVTRSEQRKGYGTYMLDMIIGYIKEYVSTTIGCRLVTVEAYDDDENIDFFSAYGFVEIPDDWMKTRDRKRKFGNRTLTLMYFDLNPHGIMPEDTGI